ncbi:MAG: hypothetical protein NWQ23_09580 [Yoonia sp.]|uniref:hypothetical protein n=1 Tax=Yoonia sp. TaxID=2212373 RepID=UPI00273D8A32|nr:hypothetical protein [Yoonia sp.]MDP5085659.1 hypothetical protein [Yoonia sp.]
MFYHTNRFASAAIATGILFLSASTVSASEIALTFADHDLTISGDFAGFEDNQYVVITDIGAIHVPAAMVTCAGADCRDVVLASQANG